MLSADANRSLVHLLERRRSDDQFPPARLRHRQVRPVCPVEQSRADTCGEPGGGNEIIWGMGSALRGFVCGMIAGHQRRSRKQRRRESTGAPLAAGTLPEAKSTREMPTKERPNSPPIDARPHGAMLARQRLSFR